MPNQEDRKKSYVGQIWHALQYYPIIKDPANLIGDFNSYVQWDDERKEGNHSAM